MTDSRQRLYQIAKSNWVWRSSVVSVDQRRPSLLALIEIPIATIIFWWIASHSPFPLLTLIAIIAAPVLLLRSPESINLGFKELSEYRNGKSGSAKRKYTDILLKLFCLLLIFVFAFFVYQSLSYLYSNFLTNVLFAMSASVFCSMTLVVCLGQSPANLSALTTGSSSQKLRRALSTLIPSVPVHISMLLLPALVIGLYLRTLAIRLVATGRFFWRGIECFSINSYETYLVIDVFSPVELMPRARDVSQKFWSVGLLQYLHDNTETSHDIKGTLKVGLVLSLLPVLYGFASLYRLNLKANAWLWGGIAWIFNRRRWSTVESQRETAAPITTWYAIGGLTLCLLGALALLLGTVLPSGFIDSLYPPTLKWMARELALPIGTMRWWLLLMLTLSVVFFWILALMIRSIHIKAMEGSKEFNVASDEEKENLLSRIATLYSSLKVALALTILNAWIWLIYIFSSLSCCKAKYKNVAWEWLRLHL